MWKITDKMSCVRVCADVVFTPCSADLPARCYASADISCHRVCVCLPYGCIVSK